MLRYFGGAVNGGVSVRADFMGVASVNKISPSKALLITDMDEWILVTPGDVFGDPTLDLTTKLLPNSRLAYKANRMSGSSAYKGSAIYLRPLSECLVGEAKATEIHQTWAYGDSTNHGGIFFPVVAIKETILNEPFMRDCRDLTRSLRKGDKISYVAIRDASTRNRHAFAVDVRFGYNKDETKSMIGILTDVQRSSCSLWAKNFPVLTLRNCDFDLHSNADLREIFTEGDRLTFQAAYVGCDMDDISYLGPADVGGIEKLARMKATWKQRTTETPAKETTGDDLSLRNSRASVSDLGDLSKVSSRATPDQDPQTQPITKADLVDAMKLLEAELDAIKTDSLHQPSNLDKLGRSSGETKPSAEIANKESDNDETRIAESTEAQESKKFADAEVQVSSMAELKTLNELLEDKEIFNLICQRYPALVHGILQVRRGFLS